MLDVVVNHRCASLQADRCGSKWEKQNRFLKIFPMSKVLPTNDFQQVGTSSVSKVLVALVFFQDSGGRWLKFEATVCPYKMLQIYQNQRISIARLQSVKILSVKIFQEPDWEGWAVCHDSRRPQEPNALPRGLCIVPGPAVPGGSGAHTTGEPAACATRCAATSLSHSTKLTTN